MDWFQEWQFDKGHALWLLFVYASIFATFVIVTAFLAHIGWDMLHPCASQGGPDVI